MCSVMSLLDWSKTDVALYPDSPRLTQPPTEQALREFCPNTVFRRTEVRDADAFAAAVSKRTLFGHPKEVKAIKPPADAFMFDTKELSPAPPPSLSLHVLIPPSLEPHHPPPPKHFLHPKAGIFTLKKTAAYQRGYVYTTPYISPPRMLTSTE
ncbi:hypothetical protein FB451DRAFT_1242593 [Mycena latifolia]|nr:hypothetical protein FB451DRAFT_1242593 [Mycena latifolia]